MLVKLTVDNFLSFEKETELTMIPSNKTTKKQDHKIEIKSTSLLKYAVIYGANASGKSNLVETFNFIKSCVTRSMPVNSSSMFCKTKEENSKRDSVFELQFTLKDKFYAYGFSANLQEQKFKDEWLYELYPTGTAKKLFEREYGEKPKLGEKIKLDNLDDAKWQVYVDDFKEDSNILFLKFMNIGKKYSENSKIIFFEEIFTWISENLEICMPHTSLNSFEYYYDDASLNKINELIKIFDTGITKINIKEITQDELKKEMPESVFNEVIEKMRKALEIDNIKNFKISMRSHDSFFNIEKGKGSDLKATTIKLNHGNSFYDFSFKEESDGTRRIFELLDILLNKTENKVYIIDEMERSLHPKLTSKFIELFDEMHPNQKIQLIFTTHESSIMDQELFRRDEIWFVERDKNNTSNIYSLDKFKERYDRKLSKAYLDGRYGALPTFSTFKFEEDL